MTLPKAQLRPAAFSGIQPYLPTRVPENGPIIQKLQNALGQTGNFERIYLDRKDAQFLRFYNDDTDLFLRLENPTLADHMARTESIARGLSAQGASVNAARADCPLPFDDDWRLFIYPFLHARYLTPTPEDMRDLGTTLRTLHDALAKHPDRDAFTAETGDWLKPLAAARAALAAGTASPGPNPALLQQWTRDAALDFVMPDAPRIPCHGDVNAGNVMRDEKTGAIVFLDFEDVTHSVLPLIFELARIIERHILVHDLDTAQKSDLANAFLKSYGAPVGLPYAQALKSHNLRSLCFLTHMQEQNIPVAAQEWQKFFDLMALAEASTPLLDALD